MRFFSTMPHPKQQQHSVRADKVIYMSDFLYEHFLVDPRVYRVARAFWFKKIAQLFPERSEPLSPYLSDRFGNGALFYDGNPIVNVINRQTGKAARVIQESPEEFGKFYSSWEQTISLQPNAESPTVEIQEKVITLTLTHDSLKKAIAELQEWLKD